MSKQKIAASTNGMLGKGFNFAVAAAAVIVMTVFAAGTAVAGGASNTTPQNVDVVNTPTVNVGNTPSVTVANTPSVNVANTPAVSIAGTPAVTATITAPGPLTNVGRLASQQLTLQAGAGTCTGPNWLQLNADGSTSCFDMANYPGQALVITDVYWRSAGTPGNTCFTDLRLAPNNIVVLSSSAVAAADNFAANSEHLTTGVAMTVDPTLRAFGPNCFSQEYQMHGYLVPNQ